jgi:hypothetical protein
MERGKKNDNPDEIELGGRTGEGKNMAHPAKSQKLWRTQKKSQTLHKKYLK